MWEVEPIKNSLQIISVGHNVLVRPLLFLQCVVMVVKQSSSLMRANLSDIERLGLLVGSLSHDLDHRGTNNQFQIKYVLYTFF